MENSQPQEQLQDISKDRTFGMKAVGLDFNPSGNEDVYKVKQLYANIIDLLHSLSYGLEGLPTEEMVKKAIQEAQTAQMRAVKVITFKN